MAKDRRHYELDYENGVFYVDGEEHSLDEFELNEIFIGRELDTVALEKHFKMITALNNIKGNEHVVRVWSSGINKDSQMSIFNILVDNAVMFDEEGDDIDSFRTLVNNADDIIISHPSDNAEEESLKGCDVVISFSIYNVWKRSSLDCFTKK